jgi:arylsulfatase A
MKLALILAVALLLAVANPSSARAAQGNAARPNIVLIFIDDMGYGDIGPFGSTKNRTPNLDRMAREGMKLTSFYAAPVCSVSRAQVMTGCYGQRVSIPGVFSPASRDGINKDEHTVAELMKAQGYATICLGKWHLGDQPEFLPTRHGFDQYFGLPYSNDMSMKAKVNGLPVVPLMRDDKVIELLTGDDQNRLTERYADEAVKFIHENKARPFFLYLPHTAVHVPIHPGDHFRDKSKNGRYGDWVEEVDWSVGKVLDTLNELKLSENTLVIFSSDNGPWLIKGKDGGEAGPLRGGKGSTWEGGMREPTIAWWPGKIAPGSVNDAVAGNIDFLPTFVTLAGGKIPADRVIDGRDFTPLLLGKSHESQRDAHFYYNGYKLQAVRCGPWKLTVASQNEGMGKAGPSVPASLDAPRLYNLDSDIGEKTNVAAEHPEVVARLKPMVVKMASELGDGKPGPQVRPPGRVAMPVPLYPVEQLRGKAAGAKGAVNAKPDNAAAPIAMQAMKVGDLLDGPMAPQVAGMPFTFSCEVETQARDGVIVAHGGTAVGYAIYMKAGHLIFAVHQAGQEIVRAAAVAEFPGKGVVEGRLAADGQMTLLVDGASIATAKVDSPLRRQPVEPFCVGYDSKNTVDDYDGKTLFKGTIRNPTFTTAGTGK